MMEAENNEFDQQDSQSAAAQSRAMGGRGMRATHADEQDF